MHGHVRLLWGAKTIKSTKIITYQEDKRERTKVIETLMKGLVALSEAMVREKKIHPNKAMCFKSAPKLKLFREKKTPVLTTIVSKEKF